MAEIAECTDCGHTWTPRKQPEEIKRPRCSQCNAEGDAIQFGVEDPEESTESASNILDRVQRQDKQQTLLNRVAEQIDRIEGTAPPDTRELVARELRSPHRRLNALYEELSEAEEIPLKDLAEIEEYVEECIAEIDEHADELERQDRLEDTIAELEAERNELTEEKERLEERIQTAKIKLRNVESEEEALEKGREFARRKWQILVPCARCGESIIMHPGSELHRAASQLLPKQGWGHTDCQ